MEILIKFLKKCDAGFIPKLSSRVEISNYSKKIFEKAEIISLFEDDELIGILAIYCNDSAEKRAYITTICIDEKYRKNGYGKALLLEGFELAIQREMKSIGLEVSSENKLALNLYNKFGFVFQCANNDQIFMTKILDTI